MSTAEIDQLRAAMRSAQVSGKGQYIGEGRHLLEVDKALVKRSTFEGNTKETWIIEFKVIESSNPTHEVGQTRSYVENPANAGWMGRFKGALLGLIGAETVTPQAEAAIGDLFVALRHDEERVALKLPENFLHGRRVRCEGMAGKSKKGGDITNLRWSVAERQP